MSTLEWPIKLNDYTRKNLNVSVEKSIFIPTCWRKKYLNILIKNMLMMDCCIYLATYVPHLIFIILFTFAFHQVEMLFFLSIALTASL